MKKPLPIVYVIVGAIALLLPTLIAVVLRVESLQKEAKQISYWEYRDVPLVITDYGTTTKNWLLENGMGIPEEEVPAYFANFQGSIPLHLEQSGRYVLSHQTFELPYRQECPGITELHILTTHENPSAGPSVITTDLQGVVQTNVAGGVLENYDTAALYWQVDTVRIPMEQMQSIRTVTFIPLATTNYAVWAITAKYDCRPENMSGFESVSPAYNTNIDTAYLGALLQSSGVEVGVPGLWREIQGYPFLLTVNDLTTGPVFVMNAKDVYVLVSYPTGSSQPTVQNMASEFKWVGSANGMDLGIVAFRTSDEPGEKTISMVGTTHILGITVRDADYAP